MLYPSDSVMLQRLSVPLGLLLLCSALAAGMPRAGRAQVPNLVGDPGFESGAAGWSTCGGAALVDAQASGPGAVHSGRYAVQFRNPSSTTGCPPQPSGWPEYIKAPQAVWQSVAIPAAAPALTVSLWYWSTAHRRPIWM